MFLLQEETRECSNIKFYRSQIITLSSIALTSCNDIEKLNSVNLYTKSAEQ